MEGVKTGRMKEEREGRREWVWGKGEGFVRAWVVCACECLYIANLVDK